MVAGLYLMLLHVSASSRLPRVLAFAAVFSLLQLAPFVGITHSTQRSLERFKHLQLGYGRTEVVTALLAKGARLAPR